VLKLLPKTNCRACGSATCLAFASGPALLILIGLVLKRLAGFDPVQRSLGALALVVPYGLAANLFFLLCEVFVVFYARIPEHMDHFIYLYLGLDGHQGLVVWMNAALGLMVMALALLLVPAARRHPGVLAAACAMVFAGTWIDKGLGLVSGGFIPSPLHEITEYVPTLPELAISLGIYAIGSLCLTVLLKIAITVKMGTA